MTSCANVFWRGGLTKHCNVSIPYNICMVSTTGLMPGLVKCTYNVHLIYT